MLFGGHHSEERVSSFCPRLNNVRTVSPVEGSAVPCTSGTLQNIVVTVACSPLQNSTLTRASVSSDQWSYGQKTIMTRQHFHPDSSSNERNCQWHLLNVPTVLPLLTTENGNNKCPLSHQSKATARATAENSVSSTNSKTMPSGGKQYLNDDQILQLIEKKLASFRAQMKVSKGSNSMSLPSCQDPALSTSAPEIFDDSISMDSREKEGIEKESDCCRQSLEQSTMENDGTVTAKQPTEYVGIMHEAAAICSKEEEESPVVLEAPGSCATIDELVKRSPGLMLQYKPSNQEYESVWRNKDPSDLSKPTQTSAFETLNAHFMHEPLKDPKYDDLTDEETPQHSTLNSPLQNKVICEDHLTALANPASGNVDINSSMPIQLDDISDDEGQINGNGSIQVETSKVPEQNFMLKGNSFAKANMDPAVTPSSEQQLVCTCYFAEYDDDDELKLVECPKCLNVSSLNQKENTSPRQGCESEDFEDVGLSSGSFQHETVMDSQCDEDDEWIVIPLVASDVEFESQYPSSHEQHEQHSQSCFQKIREFEDIFCFHEALSKEMNCTFPKEATNTAPFELLPASCNLLKQDVAEESASEPALNPDTEAEDSCDTDDSSDYPSLTNRNYLTVPSRIRAPFFLVGSSNSEDEGEVPQPPETITPRPPPQSTSSVNNFFPVLSANEDEENTNNAVNDTTVAIKVTLPYKEKRHKTKTSKKKRPKLSELNQESSLRQMKNSSESGTDSTLPNQLALQLRHQSAWDKSSLAQNCQSSSSVTNKEPSHRHKTKTAVKRKLSSATSTSDYNRKDQGKRKKPSKEAAGSLMLKRPDANHKANTQNPNTNASEARKKQPLPSQRSSTLSKSVYPKKTPESRGYPVTEMLSLNGERYQASSLPGGNKQTNQVNSYSTTKSTPAKQKLVKEWASVHVPTPKERKSSFDRDASARNVIAKTTNGKDHEKRDHGQCLARHRSNSRETPLSKRTKIEARVYTQHAHRQASTELDPDKRYSAYKWRCKGTPATNDFNWERERDSPELPKGLTEL